ncbi:MAG: methylated-DNA-protein-cysteine methyltransferase-like protein [Desulforhopalus sp.]|jgi:methylated-DNA-protein-cysteine methyltransferase-like protein
MDDFSEKVINILQEIPYGRVTTYGTVAALAGNVSGARQVARLLHSSSKKYQIPWHRVVNRKGEISERSSMSHLDQRTLLEKEDVAFNKAGKIDLDVFLWIP